ncbi:DUF1501 domain-containing protein [Rubripirellula amarantea]|uniref:DUF1501 domain-containing protein n=1 Tax=Rubripirellula amarantea TaxID=2527999 RepID=A0A5C5WRZ1_9BACT|nr:DUF1501 domain-containing protein [Rubripirellula amarantea]MDA8744168.1 DUF1501 domain-containing protein [Rubripirellula amarantea]TWT53240.1 hypothetical protein Pla22_08680 [Rubripirellula amarantea]
MNSHTNYQGRSIHCPGPDLGLSHPDANSIVAHTSARYARSGRRSFMKMGLAGCASLSLPGLLRLRANEPNQTKRKRAVIMVWKPGGCSHLDTYDPKPDSGSEYRGPFGVIPTKVPGLNFTELLPKQAAIADKFTILRSMHQTAPGHPAGSMQLLSGDPDTRDKPKPKLPDWMSVANYLHSQDGPRDNPLPRYVGINPPVQYNGPAYLGDAYAPFSVNGDPNNPQFVVPNIGLSDASQIDRLRRRVDLRAELDTLSRAVDQTGEMGALDEFESQAMTLLTNPKTKDAFDLTQESDETRDRYGRNTWGQQLLMARRLAEAGVEVLTSSLRGPLCGRVQNWDDHAVNHHIFDAMRFRAAAYDQAVSALIEDIYERGLDKEILVVVTGEFGRTPKINYQPSTGAGNASAAAGTKQPGREHWPRAFSNLWAGGGIETGRFIGATDKRGEDVIERHCGPGDFLATIYHHLGIDSSNVFIKNFNGRPTPIVDHGRPIKELMGSVGS